MPTDGIRIESLLDSTANHYGLCECTIDTVIWKLMSTWHIERIELSTWLSIIDNQEPSATCSIYFVINWMYIIVLAIFIFVISYKMTLCITGKKKLRDRSQTLVRGVPDAKKIIVKIFGVPLQTAKKKIRALIFAIKIMGQPIEKHVNLIFPGKFVVIFFQPPPPLYKGQKL